MNNSTNSTAQKNDDLRINISQMYELQYWSQKLSVTTVELRQAVKAVGYNLNEITTYLTKKQQPTA
ncbi:DUF3606 domain-containing protein [Flavobacterium sp. DGU38]|uniref:DUF3606 domain-containing protein n=1 Tax=Flavobacterium calami TaxID=3139144 RepID=A0ABU9ISP1_9FLAO